MNSNFFCVMLGFLALVSLSCAQAQEKPYPMFRTVAFSADKKWLVAGGGGIARTGSHGMVKVWDTSSWKPHAVWTESFTYPVQAVRFVSPEVVASLSAKMLPPGPGSRFEGTLVRRWNLPEKTEHGSVLLKGYFGGGSLGFHPSQKLITFDHVSDGACGIYSFPELERKVSLKALHELGRPIDCWFSADGKRVYSASVQPDGPQVRLHDAHNGDLLRTFKPENSKDRTEPTIIGSWAVSPNGDMVAIATNRPAKLYILKSDLSETLWVTNAPVVSLEIDPRFRVEPQLEFTIDNEAIALRKDDTTVELYSLKSKDSIRRFTDNPHGVNGFSFSKDGNWIAIAGGGHRRPENKFSPPSVCVFDVKTGKLVAELD